jgi:tetratricopeptide (TPR) repeat protein
MIRRSLLWIATAALVLVPLHASADSIAIASIPLDLHVGSAVPDEGAGRFTLRTAVAELFSNHRITTADRGRTILANSATESDFGRFAARVTNGRPNFVEYMFEGGGVFARSEAAMFKLPGGINDFRGFTVTGVALHVDDFSTAPASDNSGLSFRNLRGSLSVLGSGAFAPSPTPEPASITLLAGGALAAGLYRRGRRAMRRVVYAACVLTLAASACAGDPRQAAARFIASGDAFASRGKFKEAQIEYRNALKKTPRDVDAHLKLGRAYEQAKDYADAYRSYVRAADLDTRRPEAHAWLAEFLLKNGRFEDARRHASAMLDINARDVRALILLASADARLRDRAAALGWVEKALAIDPQSAVAHTMLGALQLTDGDLKRAKAEFVRATEVAPTSSEAWIALGQFHVAVRDLASAEQSLRHALAVASDKAIAHRLLGTFYLGTGRAREAEPHLKAYADATSEGRVMLSQYYAATGRAAEALELLGHVVTDPATDPTIAANARLQRAALWHATGERAKAHAELAPLLNDDEAGADAHALTAQLIVREKGDLADALAHARDAVKRRPHDPGLQYVQGTVYLARGELADAQACLRRAIVPDSLEGQPAASAYVFTVMGMLDAERGDRQGAEDAYARALRIEPNQGVAANNLAWIYAEQGRSREALRLAQTAHRVLGNQPSVIDTLGWMYYLQDSHEAAVTWLTKAADANPSNPVYRRHLDAALMKSRHAAQ